MTDTDDDVTVRYTPLPRGVLGGFVKLYGTILTSSVWVESHETFRVWMAMLVLADRNGYVAGTAPGLASIARVTLDECEAALAVLMAPDTHSRTKEHGGRRIEIIEGGWTILNHAKYRELRSDSQIATAERVAKFRAKKRVTRQVTSVTSNDVTHQSTEGRVQSTEREGTTAFRRLRDLTSNGDLRHITGEQLAWMDDRAKGALKAVGGLEAIKSKRPEHLRFMEADFVKAYTGRPS